MTISVSSFIMFLGIIQLFLAALGLPDLRMWRWFPGGAATIAVAMFVHFAVH